jgi:hypothetical protein
MLRIGNFSGYWGDDPEALLRQLRAGPLDYLTGDYLAELTMAILERQRRANPRAGYAHHFVEHLQAALPELLRSGTRIIVNAGGVNPEGCRDAVLRLFREAGVSIPIAVVSGSDVLQQVPELRASGVSLAHADTGESFDRIAAQLLSAHAYLGAQPIVEALRLGARIVITGRVTDAALALAPMMHELGWSEQDLDRLAAGVIAGHVLECGAQATGGVFTDFESVPLGKDGTRLGYPIVEVEADGSFVVTKPEQTGGVVSLATVAEQLLYEIGDPRAYASPDVIADFTSIELEQVGADRVRISGARGEAPPSHVKLSCVYAAGFRTSAEVLVSGPRIRAKSDRIRALLDGHFPRGFADARFDILGLADDQSREPREAVLRFAVRDADRARVERFARILLGLWVQGPPGVSMLGRPHTEEAFGFWPALIPREHVVAAVELVNGDRVERLTIPFQEVRPGSERASTEAFLPSPPTGPTHRGRLRAIAHARCGDKGDRANVGLRARSQEAYAFLHHALTAERVREYFGASVRGPVVRYELPNLLAFNFVLDGALGGGGSISLRPDPLGKTMSDALLEMELDLPSIA